MTCDIAIIGGGIAGLPLSIDLRRRGYEVVLIEKGSYPRHKVCGEYISLESQAYLQDICPALSTLDLPQINSFLLSSGRSKEFKTRLDLGGFGISRYLLEDLLYREAEKIGVRFLLNQKARDIKQDTGNNEYIVSTNAGDIKAKLVCNSSGRKSNLETAKAVTKTQKVNYVGVKYHIRIPRDPSLIEIHNFPGGYCGISNIEDGKSCLCYIVNSRQLKAVNHSIPELEKRFLYRNRQLGEIFTQAEFVYKEPLTISGINFLIKEPATEQSFFLGDSAGSMAPVVGNGMSMALRSASALAGHIDQYFGSSDSRQQVLARYDRFWQGEFATRIKLSRFLQKLSEYPFLTNRTIELFNLFPSLAQKVIRQTHGKPF